MTRYGFRLALGAFFHAETETLLKQLPAALHPVETHPGIAVVAVTVFDFDRSEVGAYGELVVSAVVAPYLGEGLALPDAALFPLMLATTTPESRTHAAERWHLPHFDRCVSIAFDEGRPSSLGPRSVEVHDRDELVLRLEVEAQAREQATRHYQCFSASPDAIHRVEIDIGGPLTEHEDERGQLSLGASPLGAAIAALIDDPLPLREQVMDAGEQRFGSLVRHAPLRRPA